jgi:hypothetical protein
MLTADIESVRLSSQSSKRCSRPKALDSMELIDNRVGNLKRNPSYCTRLRHSLPYGCQPVNEDLPGCSVVQSNAPAPRTPTMIIDVSSLYRFSPKFSFTKSSNFVLEKDLVSISQRRSGYSQAKEKIAFALLQTPEMSTKIQRRVPRPKKTISNHQTKLKPSWPSTWQRCPCKPQQPSYDPHRPHLQPSCRRCLQPCVCPHNCFMLAIPGNKSQSFTHVLYALMHSF